MKDSLKEKIKNKLSSNVDKKSKEMKPKRRLSGYKFENIDIKPSKSSERSDNYALANAIFQDNT